MRNTSKTKNNILFNLWIFFSPRRKYQLFILIFLSIVSGVMEIVSLASIIPFLTYLLNPNDIYKFKKQTHFP